MIASTKMAVRRASLLGRLSTFKKVPDESTLATKLAQPGDNGSADVSADPEGDAGGAHQGSLSSLKFAEDIGQEAASAIATEEPAKEHVAARLHSSVLAAEIA